MVLNVSQLKRAHLKRPIFWIDFEGRQDEPPAMVCELEGDAITSIVFDERLKSAAEQKKLAVLEFRDYAQSLRQRVNERDGLVAAYSKHELELLKAIEPGSEDFWETVYLNANMSSWFGRCLPDLKAKLEAGDAGKRNRGLGLKDYLSLPEVRYPYPKRLKKFSPSPVIGLLRSELAEVGGRYSRLKDRTKSKWVRLIEYNQHDVKGMKHLIAFKLSHEERSPRTRTPG